MKVIEEMLVALLAAFRDTPTSISRSVPLPIVLQKLMVEPEVAVAVLGDVSTGLTATAPMAQAPLVPRFSVMAVGVPVAVLVLAAP